MCHAYEAEHEFLSWVDGRKPACAAGCGELVRRGLADQGIEAHVTHIPPLQPTPYEPLNMRCPHGILWFTAPTSEQIAKWVEEGVA